MELQLRQFAVQPGGGNRNLLLQIPESGKVPAGQVAAQVELAVRKKFLLHFWQVVVSVQL